MSNGGAVLPNDGNLRVFVTLLTIHTALLVAGAAPLLLPILGQYLARPIVASLAIPIVYGAVVWRRAVMGER